MLELFGSGGGVDLATRLSTPELPVPVMAVIPLSVALRAGGDAGAPVVLSDPDDPAAAAILRLAETLAGRSRGLSGRQLPIQVSG